MKFREERHCAWLVGTRKLALLVCGVALLMGTSVQVVVAQSRQSQPAPRGEEQRVSRLPLLSGWSGVREQEPLLQSPTAAPPRDRFTEGKFREVGENGFMPGPDQGRQAPAGQPIQAVPFRLKNFTPDGLSLSKIPLDETGAMPLTAENAMGFPQAAPGHEIVVENYPDGKPKILRSVAQDEEGNYLNDGPWQVRNQRGEVVAEGIYRMGVMHGQWGRRHFTAEGGMFGTEPFTAYQGPFDSIATFKDGKLDGPWVIYDPLRRSVLEVNYQDGKRQGPATWYYPDRTRFREAKFNDGVLDGDVVQWNAQQQEVSRISYRQGRRIVRNTTYYRGQEKKSETYYLGPRMEPDGLDNWWEAKPAPYQSSGETTQDGPVQAWYSNRQLQHRGQYLQGNPVGKFAWWHENGNRQSLGDFDQQGRRTGRWIWWHANGLKQFEGDYDQGQPVGLWRSWDEAGQVTKTRDFGDASATGDIDNDDAGESILGREPTSQPDENQSEDLPLPGQSQRQPTVGDDNVGAQLEGIVPLEQQTNPPPTDSEDSQSVPPEKSQPETKQDPKPGKKTAGPDATSGEAGDNPPPAPFREPDLSGAIGISSR